MNREKLWFGVFRAMVASACLLGGEAMAELRLSRENRAGVVIVVGHAASSTISYAARELQSALKEVTGADVPVVEEVASDDMPRFVIGEAPKVRQALGAAADEDAILVRQEKQVIYLNGANDRAALYATYAFLERCVGVRWLWPGKEGEHYPKREELVVDGVEIREKPSIKYRSLAINYPHFDEDTLIWMARQRLNVGGVRPGNPAGSIAWLKEKGFLTRMAGHNVTLSPKELKEHPEWVAEYGGKRQMHPSMASHLCWSNPAVQEALKDKVVDWMKKTPGLDIVALYTADHNGFCECAGCKEMAPDVSTRWQKLSKVLIAGIKEVSPKILVSTLAYQAYREVPKEIAPYDMVGYTTYNISYRYPFSSQHKGNEKALEEIRQWQALGGEMGLRGYEMIVASGPRAFLPLVYLLREEVVYAAGNGLAHFSTEVAPYGFPKESPAAEQGWNVNRLNLYALAKIMWNVNITENDILDDWCAHAYGPAAAEMEAYYRGLEKAWRGASGDVSYFLNPSPTLARAFVNDALVQESTKLFDAASIRVKEDAHFSKAVKLDREMFKTWEVLNNLKNATALRSEMVALKALEKPRGSLKELPWAKARLFPAFVDPKGNVPKEATEVRALWDEENLYLEVVCHDSEPEKRIATRREHDDKIWSDDSVELFITNAEGGYDHLAVNSLGVRYDARSAGGMSLDIGFSPEWEAEAAVEQDLWVTHIALPLSWLNRDAEGAVAMSIKRTAPQRQRSGWPEASYHNPSGAGRISLVRELKPRVLLYDAGRDGSPLLAALRREGWNVAHVEQVEKEQGRISLDGADIVSLFHGSGKSFHLSTAFFRDEVQPFVERGGIVILGSSSAMPVERWFDDPGLALKWSGWRIAKPRLSQDVREGTWLSAPHDLRKIFASATTPSSSFIPQGEGWTPLASLLMEDGTKYPYLLAARLGKGVILVTSSNFGYGGGYEIFGEKAALNIVKLMENLYAHRETLF